MLRTLRRRKHDPGPPSELTRRVADAQQSLKFSAVGGAKIKADVVVSDSSIMPQQGTIGNPLSVVEHQHILLIADT